MKTIAKLTSREKNLIVYLLNANKPMRFSTLAQWLGCSTKELAKIILRIGKGLRILRNSQFEIYLGIDEEMLGDQKFRSKNVSPEQKTLF